MNIYIIYTSKYMFTNIIGGKLEVKLMDRCINSGEKSQRRERVRRQRVRKGISVE
jgi:hypothetical protein